jgi:hypothetical protein
MGSVDYTWARATTRVASPTGVELGDCTDEKSLTGNSLTHIVHTVCCAVARPRPHKDRVATLQHKRCWRGLQDLRQGPDPDPTTQSQAQPSCYICGAVRMVHTQCVAAWQGLGLSPHKGVAGWYKTFIRAQSQALPLPAHLAIGPAIALPSAISHRANSMVHTQCIAAWQGLGLCPDTSAGSHSSSTPDRIQIQTLPLKRQHKLSCYPCGAVSMLQTRCVAAWPGNTRALI